MKGLRVGLGYDFHRFGGEPPLALGCVRFERVPRLAGHSDGDALAHALADAVLGAAGLPDIGTVFPDTDERWRGLAGADLLARVGGMMREAGATLLSADCVVIAERPRIASRVDEMRRALAAALGVEPGVVTVRGKTREGVGPEGMGEGISCLAVALVSLS